MTVNLPIDDTQRLLRDSVAAFREREGGLDRARAARAQPPGFQRETWRKIADNGWFGILAPEAYGGMDLGLAEACVVQEELGRGLVPEPVAAATLAMRAVLHGDKDRAKAALLADLISGKTIAALAWQEENGCYDPAKMEMVAEQTAQGFRLNGVKRFVPAAEGADVFLVTAQGPSGPMLIRLARDTAGLRLDSDATIDGGAYGSVVLAGAMAAEEDIIASPAVMVAAVARAIDETRVLIAAELLGVMSQALDDTVAFVKQRTQFGRPIGSFQVLQHRLVDMWTQAELSRAAVRRAVTVIDDGGDSQECAVAASAAKARCSEAALMIGRQGIQLFGGMGYTDECDIGLFMKRALLLSAWLGNATYHRRRFAALAPEAAA